MVQKKELVQFNIQNRTDCGFDVPVFKFNVFSVNATTKYSWDVTTADLSCGYGTIVINGSIYNITFVSTLLGLLTSLNALSFGFFCSETIGANTFVYSFDDTNVYGDLDLCFPIPTTTTTTSTSTTSTSTTSTTSTSTSTTSTTTTAAPTTTTTSTSTSTTTLTPPPTTTSTTTTTTTSAPLLRTFRVANSDLVNSITLDVQINSVQVITPTLVPANTALSLTPQVDCAGLTSELLEYQIVAGYTPSSAFFTNGSGTYTGSIAGGFITFTGVDLTPNTNQDLNVNP